MIPTTSASKSTEALNWRREAPTNPQESKFLGALSHQHGESIGDNKGAHQQSDDAKGDHEVADEAEGFTDFGGGLLGEDFAAFEL